MEKKDKNCNKAISNEAINILMTGNIKVFDGLIISVLSMIKHTQRPINLFFYTMDLSEIDIKFKPLNKYCENYMRELLQSKNINSNFIIFDCTSLFKEELINSVNLKNHFTPYAMLRLLADKIDMPNKFIYLDTDTIINNDISLLYDYPLDDDVELGVVKDAYRIKNYFNSGVMLVNYKACKNNKLFEKARKIVINKKLIYTDQTALNMSVVKKVMLPIKFNSKDKYNKDIVIHHFCNVRKNFFHRIKPWEVDLVKEKMNAYNDILDDYLKRKNDIQKIKDNQI